jgi:choline dehydrogenase
MISANLNASTMMIADKASDLIRGRTAPEAWWSGRFAG